MKLAVDVETTISNKGNPFDITNKLVLGGTYDGESYCMFDSASIDLSNNLLVGFNFKFDLHWLQRLGIPLNNIQVWDCQLAEFLISRQMDSFADLDSTAEKYGLGNKIHSIKEKYWDQGIDTDQIPYDELKEYLERDLKLTYELQEVQESILKENPKLFRLFRLQCMDLLALQEMEWNGILLDVERCDVEAKLLEKRITEIQDQLKDFFGNYDINYGSTDQLSAILYGGSITFEWRVPIGVYKTGKKTGQVRNQVLRKTEEFPRLVEPIKGSELQKEGTWSTSETVLRQLKAKKSVRPILNAIIELGELEKLYSAYLIGFPKKIVEMNWENNFIHGQFNQCNAITGRLSASNPNQQNLAADFKKCMVTRYKERI